jgi:hypothetical protein
MLVADGHIGFLVSPICLKAHDGKLGARKGCQCQAILLKQRQTAFAFAAVDHIGFIYATT